MFTADKFFFDTNVTLKNRQEAGRFLSQKLRVALLPGTEPIVLSLAPGGVPIAYEISHELSTPLYILAARKIGAPTRPDLVIGAITEESYYLIDEVSSRLVGASPISIREKIEDEKIQVEERVQRYRSGRSLPDLDSKTVIVVDDGPISNMMARVVAGYLRFKKAKNIILAVPVCAKQSFVELEAEFDQVICLYKPGPFFSMRDYFLDFREITDEEVFYLTSKSRVKDNHVRESSLSRQVLIQIEKGLSLQGSLSVPAYSKGVVLFAHPNSSKRFAYRNSKIVDEFNKIGIATLLFDLLTDKESLERTNVFDIPFLASRLAIATKWVQNQRSTRDLSIGFFAEGSGAAAALWASTYLGSEVSAIVSRGGRPDLAKTRFARVKTPTLLVAGDQDSEIIEANKNCLRELVSSKLVLIRGASHFFDEPNTTEELAREASLWFLKNFKSRPVPARSRKQKTKHPSPPIQRLPVSEHGYQL